MTAIINTLVDLTPELSKRTNELLQNYDIDELAELVGCGRGTIKKIHNKFDHKGHQIYSKIRNNLNKIYREDLQPPLIPKIKKDSTKTELDEILLLVQHGIELQQQCTEINKQILSKVKRYKHEYE